MLFITRWHQDGMAHLHPCHSYKHLLMGEMSNWHREDREGATTKMRGATTTKTLSQDDTNTDNDGTDDKNNNNGGSRDQDQQ
jgi:hypothetical protein